MPFTLVPDSVRRGLDETVIRGRLLSGAYFGPEALLLQSVDGSQCHSHVHSHGMEFPEGWPILPEHERTVISLHVPALPADFVPVLVTGLGAVEPAAERVDVSFILTSPEFWASQADLHFVTDEVEEPSQQFFGLSTQTVNTWFKEHIDRHQEAERWPYIRVPLPGARYIEYEFAAGTEYQDRIWIGHLSGSERVLLGYHSGHFSLPALRLPEVIWLSEQSDHAASSLLWLTAAYLETGSYPLCLAEHLASHLPGLLPGQARPAARALLERLCVTDLRWRPDPLRGWINNWDYSQRNPTSALSILTAQDFAYIRDFFP